MFKNWYLGAKISPKPFSLISEPSSQKPDHSYDAPFLQFSSLYPPITLPSSSIPPFVSGLPWSPLLSSLPCRFECPGVAIVVVVLFSLRTLMLLLLQKGWACWGKGMRDGRDCEKRSVLFCSVRDGRTTGLKWIGIIIESSLIYLGLMMRRRF